MYIYMYMSVYTCACMYICVCISICIFLCEIGGDRGRSGGDRGRSGEIGVEAVNLGRRIGGYSLRYTRVLVGAVHPLQSPVS